MSAPEQFSSPIAGSVLPIRAAEELLATLPGVISARIMAGSNGAVEEIHILTTSEVTPKQCVRNVESALIAHLGMRVSHKKISVAQSSDPGPSSAGGAMGVGEGMRPPSQSGGGGRVPTAPFQLTTPGGSPVVKAESELPRRHLYFEDVEVRRSRTKGVACRVTLKKGDASFVGEVEGLENERLRVELAARATLLAIAQSEEAEAEGGGAGKSESTPPGLMMKPLLALEGCRTIDAFDRTFVFVGITVRTGRDSMLLTGSAEIRESPETSSVLAVLDATNRWIEYTG